MTAKREYTVQWADEYGCWNIATNTYEIATYSGDPNGDGTPL